MSCLLHGAPPPLPPPLNIPLSTPLTHLGCLLRGKLVLVAYYSWVFRVMVEE